MNNTKRNFPRGLVFIILAMSIIIAAMIWTNRSLHIIRVLECGMTGTYAAAIALQLWMTTLAITIGLLLLLFLIYRSQQKLTQSLEYAAYYDELCECGNLKKLKLDVQKWISKCPNKQLLMVKFDIKDFKLLNRIMGQAIGDQALISIATALRTLVGSNFGYFARAHDDEFYMVIECTSAEAITKIMERFLRHIHSIMGKTYSDFIKIVSGYYYMHLDDCTDVAEAIEKANIAHRRAKSLGMTVCIYDETLIQEALNKRNIEQKMDSALANGAFEVFLQAQYCLETNTATCAEALVRWRGEDGKLIFPAEFIFIFEENGFVIKLDLYVFERVCEIIRDRIDNHLPMIEISVNFSRRHLSNGNFVSTLCELADRHQVPHEFLTVELTETVIWENEKVLLQVLEELHKNKFLLSMDDFGSGYSSLGLFKNIPVDILKIDRSFFTDQIYQARAKTVIECVIQMAKSLQIKTVAEGIEDGAQVEFLRKIGCDLVQGYYFARPVSVSEFLEQENRAANQRADRETCL